MFLFVNRVQMRPPRLVGQHVLAWLSFALPLEIAC